LSVQQVDIQIKIANKPIMIEIKDLHKSYKMGSNSLHVLKGLNFSIGEGELVAIMGSSGSGKSTLLNILGMLDEADSGEYNLDGVPIRNLSETKAAQYRNKFLGFIFQSFNLINYKNAVENVALPLYYQKVPRKQRQEKALQYLEKVGLKDTHEEDIAQMCKRIVHLRDGVIVEDKKIKQVRASAYV